MLIVYGILNQKSITQFLGVIDDGRPAVFPKQSFAGKSSFKLPNPGFCQDLYRAHDQVVQVFPAQGSRLVPGKQGIESSLVDLPKASQVNLERQGMFQVHPYRSLNDHIPGKHDPFRFVQQANTSRGCARATPPPQTSCRPGRSTYLEPTAACEFPGS